MALPKQTALPIDELYIFFHRPIVSLFQVTALRASVFLLHTALQEFLGACAKQGASRARGDCVFFQHRHAAGAYYDAEFHGTCRWPSPTNGGTGGTGWKGVRREDPRAHGPILSFSTEPFVRRGQQDDPRLHGALTLLIPCLRRSPASQYTHR